MKTEKMLLAGGVALGAGAIIWFAMRGAKLIKGLSWANPQPFPAGSNQNGTLSVRNTKDTANTYNFGVVLGINGDHILWISDYIALGPKAETMLSFISAAMPTTPGTYPVYVDVGDITMGVHAGRFHVGDVTIG